MKNIPEGIRKSTESWDMDLKERNVLMAELDDYFLKRKKRIQEKNKSEQNDKKAP
ncbi:hypothetical protein MOE08_20140 [Bacillus spizizenii]|nr:hypothetical protein [Bacillus spizizenii]